MSTWKVLLLTLGIMLAVCCGGSAIVAAVNSGKTTNTSSRNGGDTPAAGVKYDNDGAAEIYANSQTQTFLEQINPGNGVTGVLVFDIPKDATIARFELHDSAFSGGVSVDNG